MMIIELGRVSVQLLSNDPGVAAEWLSLFASAVSPKPAAAVTLHLNVTSTPQAWQQIDAVHTILETEPIFEDDSAHLSVFVPENGRFLLTFHDGAVIRVDVQTAQIEGWLHDRLVGNGRLEDLTYTALAPILRRYGFYLVHAFGAAKNGRCVLFVGPPHSGKTTAGLSLLQQGWQMLGNDVILLNAEAGSVMAWPTPGAVGIRPQTFRLLSMTDTTGRMKNGRLASPISITDLVFPHVVDDQPSQLTPISAAEGLTRLLPAGMDRWDKAMLPDHLALLRRLCEQTAVFTLQSGCDIQQLHQIL